jgi:hypothetical protein
MRARARRGRAGRLGPLEVVDQLLPRCVNPPAVHIQVPGEVELAWTGARHPPVKHDCAVGKQAEVRAAEVVVDKRRVAALELSRERLRVLCRTEHGGCDVFRHRLCEHFPADSKHLRQGVDAVHLVGYCRRRREHDPVRKRARAVDPLAGEPPVHRRERREQAPALLPRQPPVRRQQLVRHVAHEEARSRPLAARLQHRMVDLARHPRERAVRPQRGLAAAVVRHTRDPVGAREPLDDEPLAVDEHNPLEAGAGLARMCQRFAPGDLVEPPSRGDGCVVGQLLQFAALRPCAVRLVTNNPAVTNLQELPLTLGGTPGAALELDRQAGRERRPSQRVNTRSPATKHAAAFR